MRLDVAFDLPFAVQLTCVAPNAPMRVSVSAARIAKPQMDQIEAHVAVWGAAATYGMAAGRRAKPLLYTGPLEPEAFFAVTRPAHSSNIAFVGQGVVCDPSYAVVLLHKLLCLASFYDPISSVSIELPAEQELAGAVSVDRGQVSSLPELCSPSFAYHLDLSSGAKGRDVEIEFSRPLATSETEMLDALLSTWLAQAIQGGYVSPAFPPDGFSIFPAEEPEFEGSFVSWRIADLSVDERVAHALVHGLSAFGSKHAAVRELTLS